MLRGPSHRGIALLVAIALGACHQSHADGPRPAPARAALAPSPTGLPVYGELPDLDLVDQDGLPFSKTRLQGHAWITNFIFTTCHMACPMLSARMRLIQTKIASASPATQLLSFSILPETDTPPVLKAYGTKFGRDPSRWTFVTGKTQPVFTAVSSAYKAAAARDPGSSVGASDFIALHGEAFVLIDGDGKIRGYYRKDDAGVERLIADALKLSHGSA